MFAAWLALANAGLRGRPRILDARFLWATLAFLAAVAVGYLVIVWVDRWRKRPVQYQLSAEDELAQYQALYERGELSQGEFERLRTLLTQRRRQELDRVAGSPPAVAEPGTQPPQPTEGGGPAPD